MESGDRTQPWKEWLDKEKQEIKKDIDTPTTKKPWLSWQPTPDDPSVKPWLTWNPNIDNGEVDSSKASIKTEVNSAPSSLRKRA